MTSPGQRRDSAVTAIDSSTLTTTQKSSQKTYTRLPTAAPNSSFTRQALPDHHHPSRPLKAVHQRLCRQTGTFLNRLARHPGTFSDHSNLLNESGEMAEKTGQAVDATYISTTKLLQELEQNWAEPLHEYSQFAEPWMKYPSESDSGDQAEPSEPIMSEIAAEDTIAESAVPQHYGGCSSSRIAHRYSVLFTGITKTRETIAQLEEVRHLSAADLKYPCTAIQADLDRCSRGFERDVYRYGKDIGIRGKRTECEEDSTATINGR
ncbi:hypothetical protein F5887DRAFT_1179029 [Amanita rubescens]|nr:hypothetical protein F5887DRAFT_1179029 [Amanita rubescens]